MTDLRRYALEELRDNLAALQIDRCPVAHISLYDVEADAAEGLYDALRRARSPQLHSLALSADPSQHDLVVFDHGNAPALTATIRHLLAHGFEIVTELLRLYRLEERMRLAQTARTRPREAGEHEMRLALAEIDAALFHSDAIVLYAGDRATAADTAPDAGPTDAEDRLRAVERERDGWRAAALRLFGYVDDGHFVPGVVTARLHAERAYGDAATAYVRLARRAADLIVVGLLFALALLIAGAVCVTRNEPRARASAQLRQDLRNQEAFSAESRR